MIYSVEQGGTWAPARANGLELSRLDALGRATHRVRVKHPRGAIREFLSQFPPGTPVALETVGNW